MRCKCVSEALGAKAVFDVYKLHLFDVAAAFWIPFDKLVSRLICSNYSQFSYPRRWIDYADSATEMSLVKRTSLHLSMNQLIRRFILETHLLMLIPSESK